MSSLRDDVLANIDIVDVVSRFVQLKRVGRNFVGLSPFRPEKTPSFTVSPEKQIFKCFSTGIGGNVITFLMEMEKIDYRDAIQILAKDAWVDIAKYQTNKSSPEKWEKEWQEKEKYKLMLRIAQQYFVDELGKSAASQQYLREKRQLSQESIQTRGLGYAPDASVWLIKLLLQKGFTEQDCLSIGLARKRDGGDIYGFYRNRITFPIYDHMGNLVGFGARAINPDDQPKYLNSSDSPLYDKSKILYGLSTAKSHVSTYDKLVVVEWYMDVIGFSRLWYPIAVGTCGTSMTPNHVKLLKRYTQNIYFLFDNDPAGIQASVRALKVAYQHDIYPKILTLPADYKDVDEWANVQPSQDDIEAFFVAAQDWFLGVVEQQYALYDMMNPVDRKRFLQTMYDMLLYVQDWTILSWYLESLAKKVGIWYDILFSQFKTYTKTQTVQIATMRKEKQAEQTPAKQSEQDLFYAFFYQTFLQDNGIVDGGVDEIMALVVEIAGIIEDEALLAVVTGEVGENHHALAEAQLWREKHWDTTTPDKKIIEIKHHCNKYLHNAMRQIIKMQSLSPEEKQELMKRIQTSR